MSAGQATRDLLVRALGSPVDPDANAVLAIIIEGMAAEASAFCPEPEITAHQNRLEALKDFCVQYLHVSWNDAAKAAE